MTTIKDAARGLIDHLSIDTLRWWFRTYIPVLAIVAGVRLRWGVPDTVIVGPVIDSIGIAAVAMPLLYLSVALAAVAAFLLLAVVKLVFMAPGVLRAIQDARGKNE